MLRIAAGCQSRCRPGADRVRQDHRGRASAAAASGYRQARHLHRAGAEPDRPDGREALCRGREGRRRHPGQSPDDQLRPADPGRQRADPAAPRGAATPTRSSSTKSIAGSDSIPKLLGDPRFADVPIIGLTATPWTKGLGQALRPPASSAPQRRADRRGLPVAVPGIRAGIARPDRRADDGGRLP